VKVAEGDGDDVMEGVGFDMAVVRQGLRDRDGKASASRNKLRRQLKRKA